MSEEKLTSNKLDIEGAQRNSADSEKLKESYKSIPEDIGTTNVNGDTSKNSNMVRENGDTIQDGADEKMLGSDDKESLALKNVEVKFISGDQNGNGDAKIDIGNAEKTFSGMTKEELMKYANDPFWVKLRWVLFILFWASWVAMLAGAIWIIIYAPKCAAPTPLVWWKKGPLVTLSGNEAENPSIDVLKQFNAKGVVYELSPDETYFVDTPAVEGKIKKLVEDYKAHDIHVVLDLTPNYVTEGDELFKNAVLGDKDSLSAFITSDKTNNWLKVGGDEKAWKQQGNVQFLSQFDKYIDLQMSSSVAQEKFFEVLSRLVGLGVKGFRLNNAKHFIIDPSLKDEVPSTDTSATSNYGRQTHSYTTYGDGLGDLLHKFSLKVHNLTDGEGFLTIRDDAAYRSEVYVIKNTKVIGFDLPRLAFLTKELQSTSPSALGKIKSGFDTLGTNTNLGNLWLQVAYKPEHFKNLGAEATNMFLSLLPGVQIVPITALSSVNNTKSDVMKNLETIRDSPVFQHGSFNYYLAKDEKAFAYTRTKSGNPGYFVAVNLSNDNIKADFSTFNVTDEVSYHLVSGKATTKGKVPVSAVPLDAQSVAIFTFVPK